MCEKRVVSHCECIEARKSARTDLSVVFHLMCDGHHSCSFTNFIQNIHIPLHGRVDANGERRKANSSPEDSCCHSTATTRSARSTENHSAMIEMTSDFNYIFQTTAKMMTFTLANAAQSQATRGARLV